MTTNTKLQQIISIIMIPLAVNKSNWLCLLTFAYLNDTKFTAFTAIRS